MTNIQKHLGRFILLLFFVLAIGLITRGVFAEDTKAPIKTQAVIELEKEMARDVPIYQDIAPRLARNRPALEVLGWKFDDATLTAVPL